jgi:HEPN domain-containing protein
VPRDEEIPGTPAEWLERAKADLALARIRLPPGGRYEDLCFHAQQAAEKAIKGVFQAHGSRFTYTHNIGLLLRELKRAGLSVPKDVEQTKPLTDYAHQTRYPGSIERVTEKERDLAVQAAEAVVAWAGRLIAEAGR